MSVEKDRILKSPLRYPGGKGFFCEFFIELLEQNDLVGCTYFEPFAGGAGVGLGLLSKGKTSEIVINDADYHLYCFWSSVVYNNERFIDHISEIDISIKEWRHQRNIYVNASSYNEFDVGVATFYLNRCNRSGILAGAGPIGGYGQNGKWLIDARFNKNVLLELLLEVGRFRDQIRVNNDDAVDFLTRNLPRGIRRRAAFVYADPPYVSAGCRLYLNQFKHRDHVGLSRYLVSQKCISWIATYDDDELIRGLYSPCQQISVSLGYSLQQKHQGTELLIAPDYVRIPSRHTCSSKRWQFVNSRA